MQLKGWHIILMLIVHNASAENYQYCCDIVKCHKIVTACRNASQTINGTNCAETCLVGSSDFKYCMPYNSLANKDYGCFHQFLGNSTEMQVKCNQQYAPGLAASPSMISTFGFCKANCGGWERSKGNKPDQWAGPLVTYLLAAVIFCISVPRRSRYEIKPWFFAFQWNKFNQFPRLLFSISVSGIIVTWDIFTWTFEIFIGAGWMLVGGLHEAVLDYKVINSLEYFEQYYTRDQHRAVQLETNEKGELILAVLFGNLDRHRIVSSSNRRAENIIGEYLGLPTDARREPQQRDLKIRLFQILNLMYAQYSFGSAVGAPVLFYIGAFIYQVVSLGNNPGNNDNALSLAFGMWWMVIVHVAIVAGCLLASNNPSSVSAVVAASIVDENDGLSEHEADRTEMFWALGRKSVYQSPFKPVTLWNRGCMKKSWIENTAAYRAEDNGRLWFRKQVELSAMTYILIGISAFALVFLPSCLAIVVAYNTPRICFSCRSVTFIFYTVCQLVLIVIATLRSYLYSGNDSSETQANGSAFGQSIEDQGRSRHRLRGLFLAALSIPAFLGAIFTGFASTLMQLVGVYRNCYCEVPASAWFSSHGNDEWIDWATDTQLARDQSKYWVRTGIASIVFMLVVTWTGWWYQRYVRHLLEDKIRKLAPRSSNTAIELTPMETDEVN